MKNVLKVFGIIAFVAVIGFSIAACGGGDDGGSGKDDEPVLTLTFEEIADWNDPNKHRWEVFYQDEGKSYNLSDALSNNKVYVFTYSFTSNVDIDKITARFINKKPDWSEWKDDIADYAELATDVKKNKKISGKVTLSPKSDASGLLKENIYLNILIHNRNVSTPATLTFYKFSLELEGNGNSTDNDTFNSLDDFKNWLNGKGNNSASSPYNVKLNLPNLSGLADFLKGLLGKFVKLDFSGSSFTSIGTDAFKGLTNLTGLTLPNGVTSIGANAFDSCTNLTDIILPSGVTSIGASAFNGCTNLNSVTFNGTITSGNFSSTTPFPGDLRDKYLAGGAGTYTRTSGGTTWTKQGGGGGGGDVTWTAVGDSKFGTTNIHGIAYSGSRFVAVGNSGKMAYSDNGTTWTAVGDSKFGTTDIYSIAYGNGKFVAGGDSGKMAYSDNGTTWTAVSNSTYDSSMINGIAYGSNKFVAVGSSGKIAYSDSNGTSWTDVSNSTFGTLLSIAYSGNRFVAVGMSKMAYSDNGTTWTAVGDSKFGSSIINGIAYGNSKFVAVGTGSSGGAYSTDNGTNWTAVTIDAYYRSGIAFGNNKFITWGVSRLATSPDGITWTAAGDLKNTTYGVVWDGSKFVAVGAGGNIFYWNGN